jgi:hypothetical protein
MSLISVVALKPDPVSNTNAEVETPSVGTDPLISDPYLGNALKE